MFAFSSKQTTLKLFLFFLKERNVNKVQDMDDSGFFLRGRQQDGIRKGYGKWNSGIARLLEAKGLGV